MVRADVGRIAHGIVEEERVGLQNLADLVANPARMERPPPTGLLGSALGSFGHLSFAVLESRATVGDTTAIRGGEHAGRGVVDGPRGRRGWYRQPEIGPELHRLVARLHRVDVDPGDVGVGPRSFAGR